MNTIEHEGQTYEVLTLDRISEITHAKLAGGKVVGASTGNEIVRIPDSANIGYHYYSKEELEDLGIIPLRLVPKEPVTFEATFVKGMLGEWLIINNLDEALAHQGYVSKRFRCVEIVEEAK
jgi:hypothetical protein